MSAYEFAEYRAYFSIEPFPELRADIRTGQLCAVIANVDRNPKKHPKPFTTEDFRIAWWSRVKVQTMSLENMMLNAKTWTIALGGKVWKNK